MHMVLNLDQLRERYSRYLIHHRVDTLQDQVLTNLSVYNNLQDQKISMNTVLNLDQLLGRHSLYLLHHQINTVYVLATLSMHDIT